MKTLTEKKSLIELNHKELSINKQCELLKVNRSSLYYKPSKESDLNLKLMRLMDEHYLKHPYKGAERMYKWLTMDKGYKVSLNRIERLYYKVMGLRSVLLGPHTSKRHKDHQVYPYLLRDLKIERNNQVWATDITYIPMEKGFMYLTAIIDIKSRYVLHWSLSNSMDAQWCAEVLEEAIAKHGKPEIINTDQGSQYTSEIFTNAVLSKGIKLSMDGKGRATDNAFIERLWRSVKYEKVYLYPTGKPLKLVLLLEAYFDYYNNERRHSSIDDKTPAELYNTNEDQLAA
jgi:putative transposase